MPDAPGLELIRGEIEERYPGAVLDSGFAQERATLVVDPEQILDVLRWLGEAAGQGYTFLASLHAADYLPAEPRFGVHYELLCMERRERLRVKALLRDPETQAPAVGGEGGIPSGQIAAEGGDFEYPPVGKTPLPPATGNETRKGNDAPTAAQEAQALPEIDSCVELFPTAEFQEREAYDFFGIVFRGHPDLRRILLPDDYVGWPQRRDFPIGGEPVTFTHNERDLG